ncbi:MAG: polysaccharide deacetylase family protein [Peptococcaceae bacterium]|nr:polysaccharide deacetylase family protein [Peptococcaceae bacterium]
MTLQIRINKYLVILGGVLCLLLWHFFAEKFSFTTSGIPAAKPIESVKTQEKVMALTINVDWGEEYLPDILQILKTEQARVTFFVTGRWAKNHPELLKQMAAEGHEIENHGYRHPHPDNLSLEANQEELQKTESVIQEILGYQTKYYAPPYGESGPSGLRAAAESGYITTLWTLDTIDWKPESTPERITQRVVEPAVRFGVQPDRCGAIILMHPKENTVKALPGILIQLKKEGFRFITLDELIRFGETGNTSE